MTAVRLSVVLCFVSALLEVQSQIFPFVRLFSTPLSNHSYVDFNKVGGTVETSVQCRTDLDTCCGDEVNGHHRGDWYFPSGEGLPTEVSDIYEAERFANVQVRRLNNATTAGIYRCEIETSATNGDSRGIVYAGLYSSGGDVIIPNRILLNVDSDLFGESPQFTLTCISTGGPATNVTWTRGSEELSGGMTVLDDPVTAQYTHTLTVIGRLPGVYRCNVSNNKPSTFRRSIPVRVGNPPTSLMAVQEGPTGIQVSWTPPSDARLTRGYRIYYSGGSSGSVDVRDSDTSNHLLTDLINEASYTISIVGTSAHFPSERVHYLNSITLIPLPEIVSTVVSSTTATSIFVSWSAPSGPAIDSYQVVWERVTSGDCLEEDVGNTTIIDGSTSYNIVGLEEGSSYMVTVITTNRAGSTVSEPVTEVTREVVPSGPPTSVSVSDMTPYSITVQWRAVDCIHRNGNITGYIVQYGIQGNGSTERRNVSGGASTEAMITGLTNDTTYYIEVAAVNSAGIGEYSNRTTAMTESGSKQSDEGSDSDKNIGGYVVGGFVGGVLITAVVGTILYFLFRRKRTRKKMENSLSNDGKQQKDYIPTSTNQAYGFVTSEIRDINHEMCDTPSGAATANEDSTYESVPI